MVCKPLEKCHLRKKTGVMTTVTSKTIPIPKKTQKTRLSPKSKIFSEKVAVASKPKTKKIKDSRGYVEFKATLENTDGFPLFSRRAEEAEDADNCQGEYYLTLMAEVDIEQFDGLNAVKEQEVEFIFMLDKSYSMSGNPWRQVKSSLINMIHITAGNNKIHRKIMTFGSSARWESVSEDPNQAKAEVHKIPFGGGTNFVAAFKLLREYLVSPERIARKAFVFFMTDGCDVLAENYQSELKKAFVASGQEIIVNVLGFSRSHNDALLESISLFGTSDGSYNYIPEDSGETALEDTLTKLVEQTTGLIGKSIYLELEMSKDNGYIQGEWFDEKEKKVIVQALLQSKGNTATIETSKFVKLSNDELHINVCMMRSLKEDAKVTTCKIVQTQLCNSFTDEMRLLKLRSCLNLMTSKLGNSVNDGTAKATVPLVKRWFQAVQVYQGAINMEEAEASPDPALSSLAKAITNGMAMIDHTLCQEPGTNQMGMRQTNAQWNLQSNQAHNQPQQKFSTESAAYQHRPRNGKQSQMRSCDRRYKV